MAVGSTTWVTKGLNSFSIGMEILQNKVDSSIITFSSDASESLRMALNLPTGLLNLVQ